MRSVSRWWNEVDIYEGQGGGGHSQAELKGLESPLGRTWRYPIMSSHHPLTRHIRAHPKLTNN